MTEPAAVPPRTQRIYLSDGELSALMREAQGPVNGRVVPCCFGPGAVWLDPATRDEHGHYPRWITLRLAILRNVALEGMEMEQGEREELAAFAAAHGREVTW